MNNFILEGNNNIVLLKEFFKKNVLLYQHICSNLFLKYFCRVEDYDVKSKVAFEVAYAVYQNQQEMVYHQHVFPFNLNIHLIVID